MKEYQIYRMYDNGNLEYIKSCSSTTSAQATIKRWREKRPNSQYQIYEKDED